MSNQLKETETLKKYKKNNLEIKYGVISLTALGISFMEVVSY
ncbi:hypothetical protein B808_225 [Fructilactobacillus florum 8D]|uniref:Uncharacterized protein n=1 Tax=Fructilactobacillus florum 8D TaxID=1221538 RepID=W9EHX3_9LACO|nr:hypothetical protein B808_225 [Fructilactobacillus florum 8D]